MAIKPKTIYVGGRRGIVAGPILTETAVYAGVRENMTVRLDRRDLEKMWEVDSEDSIPSVSIDGAFLTAAGVLAGVRSTDDGRFLWRVPTRFQGLDVWQQRVLVDVEIGIELRDAATGMIERIVSIPGGHDVHHLCAGDLVIVQADRIVKALNLVTAEVVWRRPLLDEMQARLAVQTDSQAIRMSQGSHSGRLVAFHAGSTFAVSVLDGSILWHAAVCAPQSWPTVHDGRVFALNGDRLLTIDEQTGAILTDVAHPEISRTAGREKRGTVYKGRIAIANETGVLPVFNMADGALVSLYESKVPLWRTEEADGRLLAATGAGTLLVFDESIWGIP